MNVLLSPQSEELIQQMVASGRYGSAGEVLEDALLALDEQHRLEQMRAALAIGDEEIERGDVVTYTPELFEQIMQNVTVLVREGQKPDPDVCP